MRRAHAGGSGSCALTDAGQPVAIRRLWSLPCQRPHSSHMAGHSDKRDYMTRVRAFCLALDFELSGETSAETSALDVNRVLRSLMSAPQHVPEMASFVKTDERKTM